MNATSSPPTVPAPDRRPSASHVPSAPSADRRDSATPRSAAEILGLLRNRLPELLGAAGVALLVAAVAGFVVSQWRALDNLGQAALLAAGAVVLTAQGLWAERRGGRLVRRIVPVALAGAAGLTLAAATLVLELALADRARLVVLGAGLAAAAHAGWAWRRHPDSVVLQVATVASALWAVGPSVGALGRAWDPGVATATVAQPVLAMFRVSLPAAGSMAVVAAGHLLVGVTWLAVALRLSSPSAARVGRIGACLLIAFSTLEFNAMVAPVGAAVAVLLVVGFLVVGIALEDLLLIGFGALAGLVAGLRTIWSLFSGETAVTLTIALAGGLLVMAALRLAQGRGDRDGPGEAPEG